MRAGHQERTASFYPRDLSEFGSTEFAELKSKKTPGEIFELLFGISQYLIEAGSVMKDVGPVSGTEEEQNKVFLKRSQLDWPTELRVDF